ncbi:hypothetical protein DVW87_13500 [Sphingomonas aracearum]|uniref:Uncharacterized protein n=2 Tax=Sphingomonas aracearum TaxID=2283317 RepID=A0A369VXQ0_9SPHN|nr:hypothetical protein DVW87_13500 [Sphingomonas aracearum]
MDNAFAPLPAYATPGLKLPTRRADGGWPTPSDGLSPVAAGWHLRAALNVAALTCTGEQAAPIVAGYNGLLKSRKALLARVHKAASKEPGFDAGMTQLYNFYSQLPARAGFCDAANQVLGQLGSVPDAGYEAAAPAMLATLDRPFATYFDRYQAWSTRQVIAFQRVVLDPRVVLAE